MLIHPSHQPAARQAIRAVVALFVLLLLVMALPMLPGLQGVSHYPPLHMALETLAIVVAALTFGMAWHGMERAARAVAAQCPVAGLRFPGRGPARLQPHAVLHRHARFHYPQHVRESHPLLAVGAAAERTGPAGGGLAALGQHRHALAGHADDGDGAGAGGRAARAVLSGAAPAAPYLCAGRRADLLQDSFRIHADGAVPCRRSPAAVAHAPPAQLQRQRPVCGGVRHGAKRVFLYPLHRRHRHLQPHGPLLQSAGLRLFVPRGFCGNRAAALHLAAQLATAAAGHAGRPARPPAGV